MAKMVFNPTFKEGTRYEIVDGAHAGRMVPYSSVRLIHAESTQKDEDIDITDDYYLIVSDGMTFDPLISEIYYTLIFMTEDGDTLSFDINIHDAYGVEIEMSRNLYRK